MVSSNTETGITVTYDDSDNTLDFVIGTLNQDTTGNAGTATSLATARLIGGVSFDGTADINLPGVNVTGNQDTTGNAGTATSLATARTIGGVSFDGTSNINLPRLISLVIKTLLVMQLRPLDLKPQGQSVVSRSMAPLILTSLVLTSLVIKTLLVMQLPLLNLKPPEQLVVSRSMVLLISTFLVLINLVIRILQELLVD